MYRSFVHLPLALIVASTSLPAQAFAPAPAPVAAPEPAWPATFEPAGVGTYLGASRPNVLIVPANSAAASAAAALRAAITTSKRAGVVMDAQAIGAVDGLDDRAIVERAKGQPAQLIAVVRVFDSGPGEPPSVVVTFYAPDGSVSTALAGTAGTAIAATGGAPTASAGVSAQAAESVSAIQDEAEASRDKEQKTSSKAQKEYERRFLWVQTYVGISVQTGAVVSSWSSIRQGKHGEEVRGADLYRIVGRDDLVSRYRKRQAIRLGVGIPATIGGVALMSAGLGVVLANLSPPTPNFGLDDPLEMGPDVAPTRISNAGALAMAGVGASLMIGGFLFIGLFRPHPVKKAQAMELIDDYNAKLRKELGVKDEEARLGVAPMVGRTNGLMLTGRF